MSNSKIIESRFEFESNGISFPLGEKINGKLILKASETFSFNYIFISCLWQTRGRGNVDSGIKFKEVILRL